MANQQTWLLIAALCALKMFGHKSCVEAVVLPRPPSSELQAYSRHNRDPEPPTLSPEHNGLSFMIVTSSELPKQIPPPTQPLAHSSTPQYHEVEQVPGLPQFKLLWVTRQMDTDGLDLRQAYLNTPSAVATHKNAAHRTDLLPNMI